MFESGAKYYDLFKSHRDYSAEAAAVAALLTTSNVMHGARVLEVACGTGRLLEFLEPDYTIWGLDSSPEMLAVACGRLPETPFVHAEMQTFQLDETFQALVCLDGAIGYCRTLEEFSLAAAAFRQALCPGGILLIEPWFTPETWVPGRIHITESHDQRTHVVRMSHGDASGEIVFHHLIGDETGIRHFVESATFGLFKSEQITAALKQAGFSAVDHQRVPAFKRELVIATA